MKQETFFNSMINDFNTTSGQELAIINDLRELMTEQKNKNPELFKNIILLCWNYLQELNGIKDEDGNEILKEIVTPEIEQNARELEQKTEVFEIEEITPFEKSVKELNPAVIFQ